MKIVNSPVFWVVAAIVAIGTITVLLRSRTHGDWGFKEALQNPEQWSREAERANREFERAMENARHWDESQITSAVNRFLFEVSSSRDAAKEAAVLKSLGPRVHPVVLQILGDASQRSRLVAPTGKNLFAEAPFNRACDLFGDSPPTNAAPFLAPFLEESGKEIRKDAALALGKIGSADVVAPLRKAFTDSDDYVRSYGLMGLQRAVGSNRLDASCARDLFPDIAQLVVMADGNDKSGSLREATALLLNIDRTRATDLFLSEKVLTADSPALHEVLEALANKRVSVPRERLLALIEKLEKREMKYPTPYALGKSLRLLGQHKLTSDRVFLEARTSASDKTVAEGAIEGLIASFGLEGFEQRAWEAENKNGFAALKPAQKHYLAVQMYDGQVNNGGLSQYFFNSSGDTWREALGGLEAMGFNERLTVLREAVAKFGKDGPSPGREQRMVQLAKLERKNDASFEALDDRYYKSKEVIDVLAKRYVLKNPDEFK
jgi:hypothetical protein